MYDSYGGNEVDNTSDSAWNLVELKEMARVINDKVKSSEVPLNNYISTDNMVKDKGGIIVSAKKPIKGNVTQYSCGDILLSNIRPYFKKIWLADREGGCSNDVIVIRAKEGVNNRYLYYSLQQDLFFDYVTASAKGTKMPRGDKDAIFRFKLSKPPFEYQSQVSSFLYFIDSKIELNQKMNKTLESIAQTLFKRWFIDFEFPDEDGKPYKSSGGEMVNSELGEIPKGWTLGTLGEILINVKNTLRPGIKLKDMGYVPIDCMSMNSLCIASYESHELAKSSLIGFERDDILLGAMRVYFHRVNLAPFSGVTRTTTFVLRPKKVDFLSFTLLFLNLDSTINYANSHSKGTTMPYAVWEGSLGNMPIIIPEYSILGNFHKLIYPIISKIRDGIILERNLSSIREILLPKLISGKIRVSQEDENAK